jgi:two-component sensor histidine kinase
MTFSAITVDDDQSIGNQLLEDMLGGISSSAHFQKRYVHKGGHPVWVDLNIALLRDHSHQPVHFVTLVQDITERREADQQLHDSLKEKSVLLKEIHHRVKNNMQVICSLLNLQAEQVSDPATHDLLKESQLRVRSMALVHEKLYQSENLAHVNFCSYANELMVLLGRSFRNPHVVLDVETDDINVGVGEAIPCGLILNELVSNGLKHAFPAGRSGVISVGLHRKGDRRLVLSVRDDGIGFPDTIDFRETETLGLSLVVTLTRQLSGTIELVKRNGTAFLIEFDTP